MPSAPSTLSWYRELWRSGGRWDRLAFVALLGLFAFRAIQFKGLHDLEGFLRMGGAVLDGTFDHDARINTYPPTFSVLMAPISLLARFAGPTAVRLLWGGAQLLALLLAARWTAEALGVSPPLRSLALAWALTARFVVADLNNMNVTLLLFAASAWGVRALASDRPLRFGAASGLAASLKVWPGFAVLAALRAPGRAKALLGALAGGLLPLLATFAALGPARFAEAWRFWLVDVVPNAGGAQLLNQSLKGALLRFGLEGLARVAPPLLLAAVALLLLTSPRSSRRAVAFDAFLLLLAGVLALPFAWLHYFLVAQPVLLVASGAPRSRAGTLAVAAAVLGTLVDRDLVGVRAWQLSTEWGATTLAALLLLAAGLLLRPALQEGLRATSTKMEL